MRHSTTVPENPRNSRISPRGIAAGVAVALVAASLSLVAPVAAHADTVPTLEVHKTSDNSLVTSATPLNPAGESITVTGTGYDASAEVVPNRGLPTGSKAGVYVQVGYLDSAWKPSLSAAAATRSTGFTAWAQGTNDSTVSGGYLKWTIDELSGTASFSWTVVIDKATLDAKSRSGATLNVFTVGAGGTTQAANELNVPFAFATGSALTVSKSAAIDPTGESITIKGVNYDASTIIADNRGLPSGSAAGVYIQIGYLNSTWRPSESAGSATRSNGYSLWVQGVNDTTTTGYAKWTKNAADSTASFSWTVTIDKATLDAKSRDGATLNVFTVGAGGTVQAVNELSVPVAFSTTTALTVSKSAAIDPAGESITVKGVNYDTSAIIPDNRGLPSGSAAGFYAQIGYLNPTWRPSESAASSSRSNGYSLWVQGVNDSTTPGYVKWTKNAVDGTSSFSWTVTVNKATLDAKARSGATLNVFTVGAGGTVQAANEKSVAVGFGDAHATATTLAPVDNVVVGSGVVLNATVATPDYSANAVTGAVEFSVDGAIVGTTAIASGAASFTTAALAAGSHTFSARYVGVTGFAGSESAAATGAVTKLGSSVVLVTTPAKVAFGSTVAVTATVSPVSDGTVTFSEGGTTLGTAAVSGGVATLSLTKLAVGSHSITASYAGSATNDAAVSAITTVTVTKLSATVTMSGAKFKKNSKPKVTVKVAKLANGTYASGKVSVYVAGKVVKTVTLKASAKGKVSVTLPKKYSKSISVKAKFLGSTTVAAKTSSTKKVSVKK